jgi:uncharacterized protein YdhG (YjbR/CyaY superfamily)
MNETEPSITMAATKASFVNVDEYIAQFPADVQKRMRQIRATIKKAIPDAHEVISYQMPTFKLEKEGNVIHFAGFKKHIGLYPGSEMVQAFKSEFAPYKSAKGSVQFPLDEPLPLDLIEKVAKQGAAAKKAFDPHRRSLVARRSLRSSSTS